MSRSSRISTGGTNDPASKPCSNSCANQAASARSVLRPGTILTCLALTSLSSKPRSSSTYHTGFQYWPVASMTTSLIPFALNQSASASNPDVNAENVRSSLLRPFPDNDGVRAHATTSSLPTSRPAQRSSMTSTCASFPSQQRKDLAGPSDLRSCKSCSKQHFAVPERSLASISQTGTTAPSRTEHSQTRRKILIRHGATPVAQDLASKLLASPAELAASASLRRLTHLARD